MSAQVAEEGGRVTPIQVWKGFVGTHRSLNDPRLDKSYLRL